MKIRLKITWAKCPGHFFNRLQQGVCHYGALESLQRTTFSHKVAPGCHADTLEFAYAGKKLCIKSLSENPSGRRKQEHFAPWAPQDEPVPDGSRKAQNTCIVLMIVLR